MGGRPGAVPCFHLGVTTSAPVALVTGANKGIGYSTATGLGRLGATVLVGARDAGRGRRRCRRSPPTESTPARSARRRRRRLGARRESAIERDFGVLDVLVNNAAVKLETSPSPPSSADVGTVRATFETNVFGAIPVTLALLPLLRRSARPRIVTCPAIRVDAAPATPSSPIAALPLLGYNTSKAALNSLTVQFANELRGTTFKVNAVDPGYTRTDMTAHSRPTDRDADTAADVVVRLVPSPTTARAAASSTSTARCPGNVGQMLANTARRFPERTAVSFGARTVTYVELDRRTDTLANGLSGLGVRHGDRVAVLMRNRPELLEAMYACFKAGFCLFP